MDRIFFHIDVNSAYLSWSAVNRLANGDTVDLREIPSIIGGDKEKRHGIVLAKSVPAKKYGIETAEPIVNAFKKCPTLVMEPPNGEFYRKMSHALMEYLHSLTSDIEQASIDECYLDFTPIAYMYESPAACADMIRKEVKDRFGFTVNVGISDRKVLAKMASDFLKPDKTHTLYSYEIREKMWPLPVGELFLCGKSAAATLRKLGINTIGDLATADREVLRANLKSHGDTLWEFANGIDESGIVTEPEEVKGIGNSTTAEHDVTDRGEASGILYSLCESVSSRLKKHGFLTTQVSVEIKYATFKSVSKQCVLDAPIETAHSLHEISMGLFDKLWNGDPIRLLGVRTTKLVGIDEPVQMSLFDYMPSETIRDITPRDTEKQKKLEAALSSIRDKFGSDAIKKGETWQKKK
ncbi:MAG: DNA polymerase IV [Lachnospiraceae bacterium]|nr:DNA polymerase IV [Lachnospiraceae bacterium]